MYATKTKGMFNPTMGYEEAMKQAGGTAWLIMSDAIKAIDANFGEGYAKKNPQLIAEFMKVAGNDFNTAVVNKVFWNIQETLDRYVDIQYNKFD